MMAIQGEISDEARAVNDANVGLLRILFDLVPEDYLPELLKRLNILIDAKIRANSNPRY